MRLKPESNEYISADRTAAEVRLDRVRERVSGEVCADARLDQPKQCHVVRIADRISADAERAAVAKVEVLLDLGLASEQLVLVDQFGTSRDEVLARYREDGLDKIRIQIAKRGGAVVASPDKCRCPASARHGFDVLQGSSRTHLVPWLKRLGMNDPAHRNLRRPVLGGEKP